MTLHRFRPVKPEAQARENAHAPLPAPPQARNPRARTTAPRTPARPRVALAAPVTLRPGTSTLAATGQAYYCRTGAEALCFIQQIQLTAPVSVADGGAAAVTVSYTLPPSSE